MNEIEQVIKSGRETKSLDYKGATAWDEGDKKACCSIVKDILAFANSGGGYIVVGVDEHNAGFSWTGVTNEQAASYDTTRINQFVQNYVDPPINCTVAKHTMDEALFVVIEVPAFADTPHICQKAYPDVLQGAVLYVRTDNNQSAPIKSSADFRNIVNQAVRQRSDALLDSFRAILVGVTTNQQALPSAEEQFNQQIGTIRAIAERNTQYVSDSGGAKYRGFLETWSFPSQFDPNRIPLSDLKRAAQKASGEYRGWPFLFYANSPDKSPKTSEIGLDMAYQWRDFADVDRADYWCFAHSGLFFQRVLMREEGRALSQGWGSVLDIGAFSMYVAEALKCVVDLYESLLEPAELVTIAIRVVDARGRSLVNLIPNGMPLHEHYTSTIPSITYISSGPLANWRSGLLDHTQAICQYVFERFNWETPNLGVVRHTAEKLFARQMY
ncbi:AlbA family DNA-binding domain-containing protein [Paraburkholderia fungorum]